MGIPRTFRWLLLALLLTVLPAKSFAGVFISVGFAPPPLPVYVQPLCPEPDLLWVPGYWAFGPDGYYWVPGAWVPAPYYGALWTPPYWGWESGFYIFHPGYWGRHVGYYGGVNYGYGYFGIGFVGGLWRGNSFFYNREVMRIDERRFHNSYRDRDVIGRYSVPNDRHIAYSGGPGGIRHDARPEERMADRDQHLAPTSYQSNHEQSFRSDREAYSNNNGGRPRTLTLDRPMQNGGPQGGGGNQGNRGNQPGDRMAAPTGTRPGNQQPSQPPAGMGGMNTRPTIQPRPGEAPRMENPGTGTRPSYDGRPQAPAQAQPGLRQPTQQPNQQPSGPGSMGRPQAPAQSQPGYRQPTQQPVGTGGMNARPTMQTRPGDTFRMENPGTDTRPSYEERPQAPAQTQPGFRQPTQQPYQQPAGMGGMNTRPTMQQRPTEAPRMENPGMNTRPSFENRPQPQPQPQMRQEQPQYQMRQAPQSRPEVQQPSRPAPQAQPAPSREAPRGGGDRGRERGR